MYLSHYGLNEKPFQITTDPKFLWLGEKHQEALSTLKYGILENKGFLLLTGEVGTGKTVLINCLTTVVDLETIVATIPDPDLEPIDFYNFLSDGFKMNRKFERKGDFLLELRDFLHRSADRNQKVLLIVDEAQRLNNTLLEEIRLLSNIELHDRKLINIFFVGQNEFNATLSQHQNRAVTQRISVRYNIEPLTETEAGEYIGHRLKIAGAGKKIFKSSAIHEIFTFSGGVPRLINIMCDHALLTGYAIGKKAIDARIIKECASELKIPVQQNPEEEKLKETLENIRHEIAEGIRLSGLNEPGTTPGRKKEEESGKTKETAQVNPTPEPSPSQPEREKAPLPKETDAAEPETTAETRPLWVKMGIVAFAAVIIAVGGYFFLNYRSPDKPQWELEDLTPKKYQDSLRKEGQSLRAELSGEKPPSPVPPGRKKATGGHTGSGGGDPGVFDRRSLSKPEGIPEGPFPGESLAMGKSTADDTVAAPAQGQTGPESAGKSVDFAKLDDLMVSAGNKIIIPFGRDSNEIPPEAFATLDRIAAFIIRHPRVRAAVKGYTDARGSLKYNKRISEFRTNTIKSYMVGKGADPLRIETFGLGPENPIADNATPEGREANRRVEIEFEVEE